MFTWKEFKEDKIAVHCKTEEQAKKFCKMMHEQGLKWDSGESYLENPKWSECKEETCYSLGYYGRYRFYSADQYFIYEFEEIGGKKMKFTKADLKDGMILEYNSGTRVLNIAGNFYTAPNCFNTVNRTFCGMEYDTDIDHYSDNLTRCSDEEKRTIRKVYTVKKDYRGNPIYLFENRNLDLIWERKEPIKLDAFEKEFLNRLLKLGYKWIARDKDGKLYVYQTKPEKMSNVAWDDSIASGVTIIRAFDTFTFAKWEDEEPWNIEKLLKEVE